ncbi:unnamed protein product [Fusarium equiseti]|uniref:Uncharacterized protein n=1 Tax=Fusarium equiseti TaxID=61235 RepID=A0A8J2NE61_FUSEQ|nr:unnamed protein product [Fusarium equiseti]
MPKAHDHFFGRHYLAQRTTGPINSLNPTKRYLIADKKSPTTESEAGKVQNAAQDNTASLRVAYVWRSRDNRKGRHALAISVDPRKHDATQGSTPSNSWDQTLRRSIIWVVNGFYSFLPVLNPSSEVSEWGGGLTAFIGATVFEFGSILLMLEAVNENERMAKIKDKLLARTDQCKKKINDKLNSITDEVIDKINHMPEEMQDSAADAYLDSMDVAAGVFSIVVTVLNDVLSKIIDILKGIFTTVINGVKTVHNVVTNAVKSIGVIFGGLSSGQSIALPSGHGSGDDKTRLITPDMVVKKTAEVSSQA